MFSRATVLFALVCMTLAKPLAAEFQQTAEVKSRELDKRVTNWGRGTWFHAGLGHCGKYDQDSSAIVAISGGRYASNGGGNCNQWIQITNTANGKVAYGKTRDSCPSCGWNDLDLSPSLFQKLGSLDTGVLNLKWNFMNKAFSPRSLPADEAREFLETDDKVSV